MMALEATHEPAGIASAEHDGQHDFDFNLGVWHTHIKRLTDPFSDTRAVELEGTVTVRKVWNGRAFLEEIEADGPNGRQDLVARIHGKPDQDQVRQTERFRALLRRFACACPSRSS